MRHVLATAILAATVTAARAQVSDDVVRIGVLTDLSSWGRDNSGPGSVEAAKMAVEEFGPTVLGKPIEIVSADHQMKTDVGVQIVRGWFDNNKVDAVVASNDGTAGGAIAALSAQGLQGIPVSGQDADQAALNRVARGLQTVSVWKDSRELGKTAADIAVELAKGTEASQIKGATKWNQGAKGVELDAIFLTPIPITQENLNLVIDAGWVTKAVACQGVDKAKAPKACM